MLSSFSLYPSSKILTIQSENRGESLLCRVKLLGCKNRNCLASAGYNFPEFIDCFNGNPAGSRSNHDTLMSNPLHQVQSPIRYLRFLSGQEIIGRKKLLFFSFDKTCIVKCCNLRIVSILKIKFQGGCPLFLSRFRQHIIDDFAKCFTGDRLLVVK